MEGDRKYQLMLVEDASILMPRQEIITQLAFFLARGDQ